MEIDFKENRKKLKEKWLTNDFSV